MNARTDNPLNGRDNYLTPIRLTLAAVVAVWHAFAVTGAERFHEPAIAGLSPSYMAVNGFFILSGFLIASSLERRRALIPFGVSRLLRLYPALIALVVTGAILTLFIGGDGATGSWLYPLKSLVFMDSSGSYPGLFSDHPRIAWSIPLWTLRYEVIAYLIAPALFFLGLRGIRGAALIFAFFTVGFIVVQLCNCSPHAAIVQMFRLVAAFSLGGLIFALRDHIGFSFTRLAGALVLCALAWNTPAFEAAANLVLAWLLFRLGYAQGGPQALKKIPDWSYGLYIWHWPVFQLVWMAQPGIAPLAILALGMPVSLVISALSWRYIERPALNHKKAVSDWLTVRVSPVFNGARALIFARSGV